MALRVKGSITKQWWANLIVSPLLLAKKSLNPLLVRVQGASL